MQCNITILVLILLSMNPLVHSFDAIVREDDSEFTFQSAVQPFLSKHCFDCHGNGETKADLSLDKYKDALSLIKERKIWDNVITMLEKHEMPPKEHPQPSGEEVERVVKAIDSILSNLDCGKPGSQPNAGRVTIRRLNRTEYNNTIRDLVGIDFRPANDFPADDVGYGFDNIGDVLSFSPLLAEKYLIAAESILEEAIVVMDPPKRTSSRVGQLRPTSAATKIEQAGFIAFEEGGYIIRAKVYADQAGTEVAKAKLRVTFQATDDVVESDEFEITGTKDDPTVIPLGTRLRKGSYRVGVLFLNPHDSVPANIENTESKAEIDALIKLKREQEDIANARNNQNFSGNREARQAAREAADKAAASLKSFGVSTRTLYVKSIDTDGPENPPPPKRPEAHNRLMAQADGLEPREAAREIIIRFASRAFRRPVRPVEVEDCLSLFDACVKQNQRFEICVRAALLRVYSAKKFMASDA